MDLGESIFAGISTPERAQGVKRPTMLATPHLDPRAPCPSARCCHMLSTRSSRYPARRIAIRRLWPKSGPSARRHGVLDGEAMRIIVGVVLAALREGHGALWDEHLQSNVT